jgi:hypothetical protein
MVIGDLWSGICSDVLREGHAVSDQTPNRENAADTKPVRKWTGRLWLVLLGVATVAWLAGLVWAAIWLIGSALF